MSIHREMMLGFLKHWAWYVIPSTFCLVNRRLIISKVLKLMNRNRWATRIKVHKVDYVWSIHNFSLQRAMLEKGDQLTSPVFTSTTENGCRWLLSFFPKGENKDCPAIYLVLDHRSKYKHVIGEYKIFIFDANEKKILKTSSVRKFEIRGGNSWGMNNFITNDYKPPNDILTISCELTFTFDHPHSTNIKPEVPELRLSSDFKKLLNDEEFADVVLSVKGKDFRAHKNILSARCPVFAAMFRHGSLSENQQNKVDIVDFDEQVIEKMLIYIYSGQIENFENLAEDLLVAADKYGLDGLKEMSEKELIKNLTVTNVIDLLEFSDLHHARELKVSAKNFIVDKFHLVINLDAWKKIASSHPQWFLEVCKALADKKR